jgi:hypothetical protein
MKKLATISDALGLRFLLAFSYPFFRFCFFSRKPGFSVRWKAQDCCAILHFYATIPPYQTTSGLR